MSASGPDIKLSDYHYHLPKGRIAQHPLPQRDESKLLVYKNNQIQHSQFYQLSGHLPQSSLLIFNNTKVINARLFFQRKTGATIQIFLLEAINPFPVLLALQSKESCTWECMIGNRKKWKQDETLEVNIPDLGLSLKASWADYEHSLVQFSWDHSDFTFTEIIEAFGKIPLPPYIDRDALDADLIQYQTIYSKEKGAVAAPTAGLHFTEDVFSSLKSKSIHWDFVTLHVGAGTFLPIKEEQVRDHKMHSEEIIISIQNIENLLAKEGNIIAVGTTSMRVLESLYWHGMKILKENIGLNDFVVSKLYPYQFKREDLPSFREVFTNLKQKMEAENLKAIHGKTEIFIFPGYPFRVCKGLITNYHMPQSTLILLIAAFIGEDWRKVYQEALENEYRFLSYGDSSLLIPTTRSFS